MLASGPMQDAASWSPACNYTGGSPVSDLPSQRYPPWVTMLTRFFAHVGPDWTWTPFPPELPACQPLFSPGLPVSARRERPCGANKVNGLRVCTAVC